MPRLTLAVVRYTTIDVPTHCPHCSASFVDVASPALREVTLSEQVFLGSLHVDGAVQHFDVADGVDRRAGDDFHPVAYECDACDSVIAGRGSHASNSSTLRWATESLTSARE